MSYRIGIDTGGTFTDLTLLDLDTGKSQLVKVASTPQNPAVAFEECLDRCLRESNVDIKDVVDVVHGTTVATNALLEGKGGKVGLITTAGFKDVLEIRRQDRPHLFGFQQTLPEPLIPANLRKEVSERVFFDGSVGKELNEEDVMNCVKEFKKEGVKVIGVSLLFSYIKPDHEKRIKEIIAKEYPEARVYLSSEVIPEYREYERTATLVLNAYLAPVMVNYMQSLKSGLDKRGGRKLHLIQSNGGVAKPELIIEKPANTLLSGPAAGVIASVFLASGAGYDNAISYDMGGTSTDVALIHRKEPKFTTLGTVGHRPIKSPMIEINTVGAGGGSIAWIDSGGILKVGPQSAGAEPGPACYGKGGAELTITDANLLLRRLNPDYFLGGETKLSLDLAEKAAERIANAMGRKVLEVAEGALKVSVSNIVNAIKMVSTAKGYDPREFVLIGYGGASGLNVGEIIDELKLKRAIIPPNPGVFSSLGCSIANIRHDFVLTRICDVGKVNDGYLKMFASIEKSAMETMREEGIEADKVLLQRFADMRYIGQSHEVTVPIPSGKLNTSMIPHILDTFNKEYEKTNGYCSPLEPTEFVNLRLTAIGIAFEPMLESYPAKGKSPEDALKHHRSVFIRGRHISCPVYEREKLLVGNRIEDAAIIEGKESTILVYPGQVAYIDEYRNMVIEGGIKNG